MAFLSLSISFGSNGLINKHSPSTKEIKRQIQKPSLPCFTLPCFYTLQPPHFTTYLLVLVRASVSRLLGHSRLTSLLSSMLSASLHPTLTTNIPTYILSVNFYRTSGLHQTIKRSFILHKTARS